MKVNRRYRPWGGLSWVLERLPKCRWSLLACLSTEDRSAATFFALKRMDIVQDLGFVIVDDAESRYTEEINKILERRKREWDRIAGRTLDVQRFHLLSSAHAFVRYVRDFGKRSGGNVILDVSCFPKRFFFPAIKVLLQLKEIQNLVITYSIPEKYCKSALAEDPCPEENIPFYDSGIFPQPETELIFIGVGYMALGLPALLQGDNKNYEVKLLFPFPPGPPSYQRNWQFVQRLSESLSPTKTEVIRVSANDVSDVFDRLCMVTRQGKRFSVLAPYGPKPISLAMCLFALEAEFPVYYTQPKVYPPDYSIGIRRLGNGDEDIKAYIVRLQGEDLYRVARRAQ